MKGAGFFKTLLLRRMGSSMEAGRRTIGKLLGAEPDALDDEEEDDIEEDATLLSGRQPSGASDFKNFTAAEVASLQRCLEAPERGWKQRSQTRCSGWLSPWHASGFGPAPGWISAVSCFRNTYDTVRWIGDEMSKRVEFEGIDIGLYAGSNRSGFWRDGKFQRCDRNI